MYYSLSESSGLVWLWRFFFGKKWNSVINYFVKLAWYIIDVCITWVGINLVCFNFFNNPLIFCFRHFISFIVVSFNICKRILVGVALLLHLLGRKMSKILTHLEHHHRLLGPLFLILNCQSFNFKPQVYKKVAKSGI